MDSDEERESEKDGWCGRGGTAGMKDVEPNKRTLMERELNMGGVWD